MLRKPTTFPFAFLGPVPCRKLIKLHVFFQRISAQNNTKREKKKVVQRYAESDPDIIRKKQAESKPLHIRKTPIHHGSKIKINYVYIS